MERVKNKVKQIGQDVKRKKISRFSQLIRSKSKSFYGVGTLVFLLYREIQTLIDSTISFEVTTDNIIGGIISHFIGFSVESITNVVYAAIWPATLFGMKNHWLAITLLGIIAIVYAFLRYGLEAGYLEKWHKIPSDAVASINQICINAFSEIKETNNPEDFDNKLKTAYDENIDIEEYLQQAQSHQLDNWRTHPDSCLALILLLSQYSQQPESSLEYQKKIVREAIKHELDQELKPLQQCFLYFPLLVSTDKSARKEAAQRFKKLSKNKTTQNLAESFTRLFNITI